MLNQRKYLLSVLIIASALLILLNYFTLKTSSAVRAYLNGESLYSKAQKDASVNLILYITSENDNYWSSYQSELSVPLGDNLARVNLLNGGSEAQIKKGFLMGRNESDELDNMIWLFRSFRATPFMNRAISIWTKGDAKITDLDSIAHVAHASIIEGEISMNEKATLLKSVDGIASELTGLEREFSQVLTSTAKEIDRLLFFANVFLIALIVSVSGYFFTKLIRRVEVMNDRLQGTLRLSKMAYATIENDDTLSLTSEFAAVTGLPLAEKLPVDKFIQTFWPDGQSQHFKNGLSFDSDIGKIENNAREVRVFDAKGNPRWLQFALVSDELNRLLVVQDISSFRNIEIQSDNKDKQLRQLFSGITDGFYALDREWRFTLVNPVFEELVKMKSDEILGKKIWDVFGKIDPLIRNIFVEAMNKNQSVRFQAPSLSHPETVFSAHLYPNADGMFVYFRDVTQEVLAQEKLKKSENKLRAFFDGTHDANILIDREFSIVAFNKAADSCVKRVLQKELMEGSSFLELMRPQMRTVAQRIIELVLKGKSLHFEIPVEVQASDKTSFFSIGYTPAYDSDGSVIGFNFNAADVTERTVAQKALSTSEAKYREMFDINPMPMWVFSKNTLRFTQVNDAACRHYGYSREEFLNMSILDIRSPEERALLIEQIKNYHIKSPSRALWKHRKKSGEEILVEVSGHFFIDNGDESYLILLNDVTEKIEAQAGLVKRDDLFKKLSEHVPGMIFCFYLSQANEPIFRYASAGSENLFGLSSASLMQNGRIFFDIIHSDDLPFLIDSIKTAFWDNAEWKAEFRIMDKSGRVRWITGESFPYKEEDGNYYWYGYMSDFTERKLASEEMKKLSLIASATHNAVVFTDTLGAITWVNDGFERMTGYSLAEVVGLKPGSFLQGEETDPETISYLSRKLKSVEHFRTEIINYSKDGRKYWLDIEVMPIRDAAGVHSGFMSVQADITVLKQAIEAADSARSQMQTILDNAPMMVSMKDKDGRYLFFNEGFKRAVERVDLVPGMTDYDIFDKEFANACREKDERVIQSNSIIQFDHSVRGEDFIEMKFPITNEKNKVYALGGISIKVTEQKRLERAIAEREERLRMLADNLSNGAIYQFELKDGHNLGRFTYYSSGVEALTGISREALLQDATLFDKQIHPDSQKEHWEKVEHASRTLTVFDNEFRFRHVGGEWKWLRIRSRPLRVDHETILWNGLIIDITEMKRSAALIAESEARFQHIANDAPVLIWMTDEDQEYVYFNEPWYRFTGRTPQQELGLGWIRGVHPNDRASCIATHETYFTSREKISTTFRLMNANGEYRYVLNTGVPRFDDDDVFLGFIGSCIDITETKNMTLRLEESQHELEKLLLEKDFLIREIHHRVKNNLQLMSSVLFLKAQTLKDPVLKQVLVDSRQKLRSISLIHERLMQFGGQITRLDIHDYIHGLVEEQRVANAVDERVARIRLAIEHHYMNLEQVVNCGFIINEALTNSLKYAFPDGKTGAITISFKRDDSRFILTISDNGVGLSPELKLNNEELFGFQLIQVFTEHLKGEARLDGTSGTTWVITFNAV